MNIYLIMGIWIVFALLCVFVFFSSIGDKLGEYTSTIRRSWYLVFIFGCIIVLTTNEIDTLFTDWEKYLIVLIVFIVIDSLLFLELHFAKLGGQELKSAKVQVGVTQEELDSAERKISQIPNILISFDFISYNINRIEYISQLDELLERYAASENLSIDLLPYGTLVEKEVVLSNLGKSRNRAKRFLSQQNSLTLSRDNLALYPFKLLDYDYVVQVQTIAEDDKVTKVDGTVITTLVIAYNLTVDENNTESGEK